MATAPKDPAEALRETKREQEAQEAAIQLKAMRSHQVKITLTKPIKMNGVEQDVLTLRRATSGDLMDAQAQEGGNLEVSSFLIARLAGCTPDDVRELDMGDWRLADAAATGFLEGRAPKRK